MACDHDGPGVTRARRTPAGARKEALRLAARRTAPDSAQALRATSAWQLVAPLIQDDAAHVFISYSRVDMALVRRIVRRLRARGARVAWDQDFDAGSDFRKQITRAIDRAACVLVVWSRASVRSIYVQGEATRAMKQSKLVPVFLDGLEFDDVPIGLGHLQAIPVKDWRRVQSSLKAFGIEVR
jgi:hypothetical protein